MILRTTRKVAAAASRRAFTLTEMLVVVAIIVVLASIAVPTTLYVLTEQKINIAKAHIKATLVGAVNQYKLRPSNETNQPPQSLEELVTPTDGNAPILKPEALIDPWGRQYQYVFPGQHNPDEPDIWSQGPNPGDESSKIGNWMR